MAGDIDPDVATYLAVSFLAIAAYNTLVLLIWIFNFFKRWRGLYFWSILSGTISIAGFMIITILSRFQKAPSVVTGIGIALLYPCLLTSQILVLYSRLHLITTQGPILRFVLWAIIITSCILLLPFTIILIGLSTGHRQFLAPEQFIERFMIIGTVIRELILCAIYIYQAIRQLKPIIAVKGRAGRKVMIHLILVIGAVIVLDAFMLTSIYIGASGLGLAYTCVAQSVKLKMEFGMLNRLLELLGAPIEGSIGGLGLNGLEDSQDRMVNSPQRLGGGGEECSWAVPGGVS
ncbi:hypothetical protein BDW59DRAFT_180569 [Aspergillus cavernicola]|uniref:DUF7703 domain-containing protein n=1 Tax=Aspergillus cavernicola TaxID=176166 RepID=A0ABR4I7I9_9EURO